MTKKPTYEELEQRIKDLEKGNAEHKLAQEALQEREDKYSSLFENTGTATFVTEEDMTVSQVNAKCEELSGYSRNEIEGKMKITDFVLPGDLERIMKYHFGRRKKDDDIPPKYELKFVDKNGNIKNAFIQVGLIPRTKQSIASVIDITPLKQAEEALRESEERYSNLFHFSNDGIFVHDLEDNIIDVNQKTLDQFGYSKSEILSLKITDLHPPEALEKSRSAFETIIQEGFVSFETDFKKKNNEVFPADVSSSMFEIEGKKVIQGIVRDITERKKIEEAIQLSKAEWVSTFDAISDWVSLIDLEYKIVRSNRAGEKLLNISTEETIGRTCCDLVHGTAEPISGCPMQKMLETQRRESLDLYVEEMKRWLRIFVDPVMDEYGNIVRAVHIVRDITESKQKEEALRQSEERLSLATETANLAIWEWRFDTGKVYGSSEKLFEILGLTREETQNFSLDLWLNRVHPDDKKRTEEKVQALFRGETERLENELRVRHPKKGWIWLYAVALVVDRDKYGKQISIVGVHRDITDRKHAEEEREKLIKELQGALKEIKTLRGILPLCSFCKKIRDDRGYWEQVDVYIHKYSQADISHSICPECAEEHYPDLDIYDD